MKETILRRPAVEALVGLRKTALYAMIARGEFPPPLRLGRRAVGWRASDVEAWIAARPVCERTAG
jgi:prophage regulatory protein